MLIAQAHSFLPHLIALSSNTHKQSIATTVDNTACTNKQMLLYMLSFSEVATELSSLQQKLQHACTALHAIGRWVSRKLNCVNTLSPLLKKSFTFIKGSDWYSTSHS